MKLQIVPSTGPLIERILDDTFQLWHEDLTRDAYGRWWRAQLNTAWGAAHLDRVALLDGASVLSSAKRYDLACRLDGRIRRVLGIGAVFTPPSFRRRGAARELLTQVLDAAVAEGYEFAALFSEIPPAFYERLDFVPVPLEELRLEVRLKGGAPAMLVRSGEDRDLPFIADLTAARSAGARLAMDRSEDLIKFFLARKRLQAGLGPPGLREVEFLVAEEGYQAVAYVICSSAGARTGAGGGVWMIEEAGDRDPSGARLGAILQVMLARHPAETPPVIRAWFPHTLSPPQVQVVERMPTKGVFMIRPLQDRTLPLPPLSAAEVVYWHSDYF
jgi:GNAT superfamily N-acetyltransferase